MKTETVTKQDVEKIVSVSSQELRKEILVSSQELRKEILAASEELRKEMSVMSQELRKEMSDISKDLSQKIDEQSAMFIGVLNEMFEKNKQESMRSTLALIEIHESRMEIYRDMYSENRADIKSSLRSYENLNSRVSKLELEKA